MRVTLVGMFLGALTAAFVASSALSEPVEFRLRSGELVVKGDLLSTDGNSAMVASPSFGVIMLEPKRFDCTGPGCGQLVPDDAFAIHGSNTIGEALTPALIRGYAAQRQIRVETRVGAKAEELGIDFLAADGKRLGAADLRSHGSGTAFPALANGTADIGASSRPIKAEEAKILSDAGVSARANVLALDGILLFVSPTNPVGELTLDQISKIFAGQITDWSQVGRAPGEIKLYARDAKSGTYDTFNTLVLTPAKLKLSEKASRLEILRRAVGQRRARSERHRLRWVRLCAQCQTDRYPQHMRHKLRTERIQCEDRGVRSRPPSLFVQLR